MRSQGEGQEKVDAGALKTCSFGGLPHNFTQVCFPVLRFSKPQLLISVLCLSLFGVSCAESSSTQLVVLMDTDYAVPTEANRIRARVLKVMEGSSGPEERETWVNVFSLTDDASVERSAHSLPATFGILPSDGDLEREIVIELEALASAGDQVLVSRRAKTGFIAGEARLLRVVLYRACAGVSCSAGQTCGCPDGMSCAAPSCMDETVPPEELESIGNPGVLPPDAGTAFPDSGTPGDGGITCGAPLTLCGVDCVNTQADPRYCGDCETSCPSGHVCDAGICTDPGDCRADGTSCIGFTYCDESSGECLPGCTETEQCTGGNEVCDSDIHDCICAPGFEACAPGCVDTAGDPDYCGDCATSCPIGQSCALGMCLDLEDCRTSGLDCAGFTYCDAATGDCLRGCDGDDQCAAENEVCDTLTHECVCGSGFHQCGNVCVSDLDPNSCGALCTPCPAPPNSSPICDLGACDFQCADTYERCDQMCCPTSCPPGQALYMGSCAPWHLQTVDAQGGIGEHTSIAVDASDSAHIGYYARSGKDLMYAGQQAAGSWSLQTPDSQGDVGQHTSIAVDATGGTYIAYYSASDRDLMLASRQGNGAWAVEVVDGVGDVGQYASLAFDRSGVPHISYYDIGNKDLRYATRQSNGAWLTQTIDGDDDDDPDVGKYTSLAFDQAGAPHISYYGEGNRELRYATEIFAGSWRVETVDKDGDVGKYTSVAVDETGAPRISYYRETGRDLMYARRLAVGFWVTEAVESQDDVGKYTSLAIDGTGRERLTYFDETARDLKYAIQPPSGPWVIEAVDSVGDVGRYTSIAVDSLGHAHVSYYDTTNRNLKYALIAAPE